MAVNSPNLRKAAVLLRSLDGETAATMLAQLSPAEGATLRRALRELGPVDADEQSDVLAEFRRITPLAAESATAGVELHLSGDSNRDPMASTTPHVVASAKRFEFLERAPVSALAPYLAREHVQTIAVVLSHLPPERAAAVLAAFSGNRQAEVIERLAVLGDTDPDSVTVVEHELAAWLENRTGRTPGSQRSHGAAASILAAADAVTRDGIIANLKAHKSALAEQLAEAPQKHERESPSVTSMPSFARDRKWSSANRLEAPAPRPHVPPPAPAPVLRIDFDHLIELNDRTLAAVLRDVDPSVLVLALAGSRDDLIERICTQMPKRAARAFRRQLRRLGPTRLSDVETAQRAVEQLAAQRLSERRVPAPATVAS